MAGKASKLIQDLSNVPSIVAGLGLGIAAAQKAFNLDYLENLERLVVIARSLAPPDDASEGTENLLFEIVKALAPSRYQFTETTLSVKLDLAQTMSAAGSVGLGAAVGAVAVNAGLSLGYGYDYRAAAQIKTVLHAYQLDPKIFESLLTRADASGDLTLPEKSTIDTQIKDQAGSVFKQLTGKEAAQIEETPGEAAAQEPGNEAAPPPEEEPADDQGGKKTGGKK